MLIYLRVALMKMSKELFNELCEAIDTNVMSTHSIETITGHRQSVKFVKNQFISFCWSIYHASKFDSNKMYKAGLNDSHIETTLKRILSDFA